MSEEGETTTVKELIKNHPKLVGMLFATMIAISQASAAAATAASTTAGP
jgi:hypothetical protein